MREICSERDEAPARNAISVRVANVLVIYPGTDGPLVRIL